MRLCRVYVIPCQQEVNLPIRGEVTLSLFVDRLETLDSRDTWSLAAWYVRLLLQGEDAVRVRNGGSAGNPFQERGFPGLALNGWTHLSGQSDLSDPEARHYYPVRNGHNVSKDFLEYGVTLVAAQPDSLSGPTMPLPAGDRIALGNVTFQGARAGTTHLEASDSTTSLPQIVVASESGDPQPIDLGTFPPVAVVNVGPEAEKARLQGRIWSDLPMDAESFHPYTGEFEVELWQSGAVPTWRGGTDRPVAVFTHLTADREGDYRVLDLAPQIVPSGRYDLRAQGPGTLTVLAGGVRIDTSGNRRGDLPVVVEVDFGPLPSGDLNGDNVIDEEDLAALEGVFGTLIKGSNTPIPGDINDDGVVDGQDFSRLAASYEYYGY